MANPYEPPQVEDTSERTAPVGKLKIACPQCGHRLKGATTAMIVLLALFLGLVS